MIEAAGPQAGAIARLFWPTVWVFTAVFVMVMAALAHAVWKGGRSDRHTADRRVGRIITGAVIATAIILFAFLAADLVTARTLVRLPRDDALTVTITGHQWWWEITYEDTVPARRLTSANELYIPVGRPVRLQIRSADVIHSFWVPALHGKRDLIPGYTNELWLRADEPGVWFGQCAEFCGHQHAHMRLLVTVLAPGEFDAWYAAQLRPSSPPSDTLAALGQRVFLSRSCAMCHTVRGTPAGGRTGPDLTHLASRRTLAAGTLPNTQGNLAGWIVDPQRIKPGANMPPNSLAPSELEAVLAFLGGLR